MQAALERVLQLARAGSRHRARESLDGWDAWIEGEPLVGAAAWRAGLAARLGREGRRVREYKLLSWQTERLLPVLLPLAGASWFVGGRLRYQAHVARWQPHAATLADLIASRDERLESLVRVFGHEVGRLHALRGRHGGLHPARILVAPPGALQPLVWSGSGDGARGPWLPRAQDDLRPLLAALRAGARADLLAPLWSAYEDARRSNGRPQRASERRLVPEARVTRPCS
jgi:hypothetical protein